MADIKQVADGIADRLETIDGLGVHREPPGTVESPAAAVSLESVDYDSTMSRGSDDLTFVVDLFLTDGPQGLENLYAYLNGSGAKSIKAAVEEDPTLGGVAMYAVVTEARKPNRAEVGQGSFLHAEVAIVVCVAG